jgi:hypothetical protein
MGGRNIQGGSREAAEHQAFNTGLAQKVPCSCFVHKGGAAAMKKAALRAAFFEVECVE